MAVDVDKPNLRIAIVDPYYFSGRKALVEEIRKKANEVWILLGGSRIGKTSLLNALEWNLLDTNSQGNGRTLPVLIDLNQVQPESLNHLRFLIVSQLRKSMDRWHQIGSIQVNQSIRELYRSYQSKISNTQVTISFLKTVGVKLELENAYKTRQLSDEIFMEGLLQTLGELQSLEFDGICFLLDNAEFIAKQEWATDAWNYFRSFKDSKNNPLNPYVGFIFSGYRELKDYQQKVGSPLLNIANIKWLSPLCEEDIKEVIRTREEFDTFSMNEDIIKTIIEWTGCHPCLVHLMLDIVSDKILQDNSFQLEGIVEEIIDQQSDVFSSWWNEKHWCGRLEDEDRDIYRIFMEHRKGDLKFIAQIAKKGPMKVKSTLQVLCATGLIRKLEDGSYCIGARLFEEWVIQN